MITVIWYANEIDYISHSYSTNYHCVKVLLRMRLRPNNNNKKLCVDDHWFQSRGTRNYLQLKKKKECMDARTVCSSIFYPRAQASWVM